MSSVFEVASSLTTPLALGGFFAAVVFFIFKQIVSKNIFPKLNSAVGADILKLIIERLFVLSLVAMILGFVGYSVKAVAPQPKPSSNGQQIAEGVIAAQGYLQGREAGQAVRAITDALELYKNQNGTYPNDLSTLSTVQEQLQKLGLGRYSYSLDSQRGFVFRFAGIDSRLNTTDDRLHYGTL